MGRNGKIARLSRGTREQLNRRLMDGEPAATLLPWLNGLPETQALVASEFGGKPVNAVNLTKWRQGGLLEESATLLLLEAQVSSLDPNLATEGPESATFSSSTQAANSTGEPAVKPDSKISLGEVSALLTMRYTALLHLLDEKDHGAFRARLRPLRQLTREVARLRRGEALGLATELRRSKMVAGRRLQGAGATGGDASAGFEGSAAGGALRPGQPRSGEMVAARGTAPGLPVAGGGLADGSGNQASGSAELDTRQGVPAGAKVNAGKLT